MYSIFRPTYKAASLQEPSPEIHELVRRLRIVATADEKLAKLIDELNPYLPIEIANPAPVSSLQTSP